MQCYHPDCMSHESLISAVKRTTIVVKDLERSLTFYRDLLGLSVFFDGTIPNPGASDVTGIQCESLRMVVLRAEELDTGMIGLMDIHGASPPLAATRPSGKLRTGESILVIPTNQLKSLYARLKEADIEIVTPPVAVDVPDRPEIHEMMMRDPDGVVINVTQRGPLA